MFQAELRPARLLKQIIEALKEVVQEVQLECSEKCMQVQAMDSSHVSLVALELNADKFQAYRCEKAMTLGINVGSLAKILKCAGNDDTVQLKADEGGDQLSIRISDVAEDRVSEFSMKLLEIEADALGIPQQDYTAAVTMPSSEFSRICKDIANFGDTITVDVKKDGVSFSAQGDIGTGRMHLKARREVDVKPATKEEAPEEAKEEAAVKKEGGEGKETPATKVEPTETAETTKDDEKTETKPEAKPVVNDDDAGDAAAPPKKRARKEKEEKPEPQGVRIECDEPVSLQFALRYLAMFAKAQGVSETVNMKIVKDAPLMMEYEIAAPGKDAEVDDKAAKGDAADTPVPLGTLRYYLAPKVGDGDDADGAAPAADE